MISSDLYTFMDTAEKIKLLHTEVETLFRQNKDEEDIITYIISKGYDRHYAEMVLGNIQEDAADKKNFWKTLFYGIGFLIAGILVTVASYFFSISGGLLFFIFYWGLIVTGISIIARAFIVFRK